MSPQPFVGLPPTPELAWCAQCSAWYWDDAQHSCGIHDDPLGVSRGVLIALSIAIIAWLLVLAGVVPWRAGWFS